MLKKLALAGALALAPFSLAPAAAAPCEFKCKIRVHVCRADAPNRCADPEIYPDEPTGLCMMLMTGAAFKWIIDQRKSQRVEWVFKGAQCVAPDDFKL
jgi:hypothetical protein